MICISSRFWQWWVSVVAVKSYMETEGPSAFLQQSRDEVQLMLDFYMLGRGIFELRYQLLNHINKVQIPMQALLLVMEAQDRRHATAPKQSAAEGDGEVVHKEAVQQP